MESNNTNQETWEQISLQEEIALINSAWNNPSWMLTTAIGSIGWILGNMALIPLYVFFLLYYKPLIVNFIFELLSDKKQLKVAEILEETKATIQTYAGGMK